MFNVLLVSSIAILSEVVNEISYKKAFSELKT